MNTAKFEAIQADIYQLSENVDKKMSYVIDLLHAVMENHSIQFSEKQSISQIWYLK